MTKVLLSYGTDLRGLNGNFAYEIGEKLYFMLKNDENLIFVSHIREGNTFEFYPPKDLKNKIDVLDLSKNDKILDIYSTSIWDAIGRKHEQWEGNGKPPEFLIELPPNATGNEIIREEEKPVRGIITPYLNTVGKFSYENFIKKIFLANYHPVFISCNEVYVDEDSNYEVRKELLAEELEKIINFL
ncbi:MAG: hypothetical protein JSV92_00455 [archaeon]|nr:MAG: hypothetical protein JSV92_00455 [archaeon]